MIHSLESEYLHKLFGVLRGIFVYSFPIMYLLTYLFQLDLYPLYIWYQIQVVYQFPTTTLKTIISSGFRQHKCIVFHLWKSELQNGLTRLKSCCIPSRGSDRKEWKGFVPLLYQLLEAAYIPWLMESSLIFKASSVASSNLSLFCLSLPFSLMKTLVITLDLLT